MIWARAQFQPFFDFRSQHTCCCCNVIRSLWIQSDEPCHAFYLAWMRLISLKDNVMLFSEEIFCFLPTNMILIWDDNHCFKCVSKIYAEKCFSFDGWTDKRNFMWFVNALSSFKNFYLLFINLIKNLEWKIFFKFPRLNLKSHFLFPRTLSNFLHPQARIIQFPNSIFHPLHTHVYQIICSRVPSLQHWQLMPFYVRTFRKTLERLISRIQ